MGIFAEEIVTTDTLGRRTGPRTRHTIEEKLRIVEEARAKGASVAMVARRHNLNANQVFAWRRQHRRGLLNPQAAKEDAKLLPVTVRGACGWRSARACDRSFGGAMIALPAGVKVWLAAGVRLKLK